MKRNLKKIIFLIGCVSFTFHCSKSPTDAGNSPSDHTVNKGGVKHKAGYTSPLDNCASCHGTDLTGGSAGVSCFKCHGKKW